MIASDSDRQKFRVLADAAKTHGSPAIRTVATIGGNLGTASPAGDLIPSLMVMDAEVLLASAEGERVVPVKDFFTGPGETVRTPDELIVEIHVPLLAGKAVFKKIGLRKAQTCSIASAAVRLEMDGKVCKDARIVLGSMAPTPIALHQGRGNDQGQGARRGIDRRVRCHRRSPRAAPSTTSVPRPGTASKAATALVARALAQAAGV